MNLEAYFKRIGYDGPAEARIDVLRKLHLLHPKSIPFENLNPFLGLPVNLDSETIQQKLIHEGRGGYCFEHNLLFKEVLEHAGFEVKGLAARILWNRPENEITPRGHMLLLVKAEGKQFVADVGFGGLGTTAPLLLEPEIIQETPHENFKLIEHQDEYTLFSEIKEEWKPLYRFNLDEHYREDYEVTNWYLSHHPESHFVTGIFAARPEVNPKRRYALRNNQLSVHTLGDRTEKRQITSVREYRNVLQELFLIRLPEAGYPEQKILNLINQAQG